MKPSRLSKLHQKCSIDITYLLNVYDVVRVLGEYLQSMPEVSGLESHVKKSYQPRR